MSWVCTPPKRPRLKPRHQCTPSNGSNSDWLLEAPVWGRTCYALEVKLQHAARWKQVAAASPRISGDTWLSKPGLSQKWERHGCGGERKKTKVGSWDLTHALWWPGCSWVRCWALRRLCIPAGLCCRGLGLWGWSSGCTYCVEMTS